jgi:hypothetical protein
MSRLLPALLILLGLAATGCTPSTPVPADAVTFQTIAAPMVGGFCSYFAEDKPGKPCLDGMEDVFAAHPELAQGADSSRLVEVTAQVSIESQTRSNSANPPQTTTMTVWKIGKVYAARQVN